LGIELDRHLSVQFSDGGPPLRQPRHFFESDALPETANAVGGRAKGTKDRPPDLKPFRPNKGRYQIFVFA
jgi:hypothetical protein